MTTMTMPAGQQLTSIASGGRDQNGVCQDDSWYEIVNGERVELPPMSILAVFDQHLSALRTWSVLSQPRG